ncbi:MULTISPECIES: protein-glutamate O-methyltransferase CheR [unclassified Nitratiruptor]|uniref:CheR family methyltransferase n=1 Tax=unclassified Nitratiruptor TaxID=2624044 RepID=UPI0019165AA5|nr:MULTISPECIES: protein-glutamate O-methyltransferase CheR [unclassified Nitratiruptor]BCD60491.1 chemotaxis protein methyltransferase CheR [Nitratiruptor sp. YY08-10]BCD64020.1 chemotaxis protein methyltransferase CheR [Nitratiruptor sp. YY08-14]
MECYEKIKDYFYQTTGIIFDSKEDIVQKKIEKFFRTYGYQECEKFQRDVRQNVHLLQQLIDFLTVSLSFFYREIEHFEFIAQNITPNSNTILSIPCATGEEPYSLTIYLLEHGIDNFFIDAVDISTQAIMEAKKGCYPEIKFRYMPKNLIEKYFTKNDNKYCIKEQIKEYTHFFSKNIFHMNGYSKRYDFILCRNLFIYFDQKKKLEALHILEKMLKRGGYLIIGKTDYIDGNIASMKKIEYKHLKIFQKEE